MNKLFLISQEEYNGYDTYDSAVVCAPDENYARNMNPSTVPHDWNEWANSPDQVTVQYLGDAAPHIEVGVICASYNAG